MGFVYLTKAPNNYAHIYARRKTSRYNISYTERNLVQRFQLETSKKGARIRRHGDNYLGLIARKPVFWGMRTTQAQTSLRIRAV